MSMLARYLATCVSLPVRRETAETDINTVKFPDIEFDEEFAGLRFEKSDEYSANFIREAQKHGYNKDFVFKKPIPIDCNGEKLNVIRLHRSSQYGDKVWTEYHGDIYENIDPVFPKESDYNDLIFEIGDIVDGKTYKNAKILRYTGQGCYVIGFRDGFTTEVHINSMKNIKLEPVKNIKENIMSAKTEVTSSPKSEILANKIATWLKSRGLKVTKVTAGESKSGKVYFGLEFSYPDAIRCIVHVYGKAFVQVVYEFLGKKDKFVSRTPEEFYETVEEKFGSFMKD